jgi:hypothetical protein
MLSGKPASHVLPLEIVERRIYVIRGRKVMRAIAVNIAIVRAFVRLRQLLATHRNLAAKVEAMEKKYDSQFKAVFEILRQLTEPPAGRPRHPIGFVTDRK